MLRLGWFGDIHGFVEDHPPQGPPMRGAVTGNIAGRRLYFSMQYPVYYVLAGERRLTLREFLETEQGIPLDEEILPAPIHFKAKLDPARRVLRGTWHVDHHRVRFRSRGQVLELAGPGAAGSWAVRRQSAGGTALGCALRCLTGCVPYLGAGILSLLVGWAAVLVILSQVVFPPEDDPLPGLASIPVGFTLGMFLALLIHEAGHFLAAWAAGLSVNFLYLGPVIFTRASGRWRLAWDRRFVADARNTRLGAVHAERPRAGRGQWALFLLGGPLANLATAVGAAALVTTPLWAPARCCAGLFAVVSVLFGLINLLPMASGAQRSDGLQLWCLLAEYSAAEPMRVAR